MDIPQYQVSGVRPGPHLLIIGGVHGDEYEPIASIRRLIRELKSEEISGKVTLIPIANEPAFSSVSRTGPDQLDLARTFPGRIDGTVTEQIAFKIAERIREADYLIDLHTGGLIAKISPLSGYMLHPDPKVKERQKDMARAFNLPVVWGTTAELDGRTLSVARDAGIPAIYAEWGGGGGCDPKGVEDYVQGCLNVMRSLGMRKHPEPVNRVQYLVEDHRNASGVLQTNYPAEVSGYFEPQFQLNEFIDIGQTIGHIYPSDGGPPHEVKSLHQGILILLRAIPSVKKGDFLAVILEINGPGEVCHE